MPTNTYTPLANITLGSAAASVTFSSISQAYRDLILVAELSSSTTSSYTSVRINSDAGAGYYAVHMFGNGTTTGSQADNAQTSWFPSPYDLSNDANNKMLMIGQLLDYSATDKNKVALWRTNRANGNVTAAASRWSTSTAITSLQVFLTTGNIAAGSSFSLFGIAS